MVARRTTRPPKLVVTTPERVLYPGGKFTKTQVVDYYVAVSPFLLPHFKKRPVTLKRYPAAVHGEFFYEKDAPGFTPEWVKTIPVPRCEGGPDIQLLCMAQQWLKPRSIAQVRFAEWTNYGLLRHATFPGLRDDKKPREVTRAP